MPPPRSKSEQQRRRSVDANGSLDVNGPVAKLLRAGGLAALIPIVVLVFNAGGTVRDIQGDIENIGRDADRNCHATKALAREEADNSDKHERAETFTVLRSIECG